MASELRHSCTIKLESICSPAVRRTAKRRTAKRRTPECYTDDDYSGTDTDTDTDDVYDPGTEYSVPASFRADHLKQLKQLLKKRFGRRLISVEFEIVSNEKLQTLQSIESVLTPFGDRDKYWAIRLTFLEAGDKRKYYFHPIPKTKTNDKPDPELVKRYKGMYDRAPEKVGICELSEVLDKPNLRRSFYYSTPDHPELRPLPTEQDIKIAKLEAEVDSLKTMVLEMQKMFTDLTASRSKS